MSEEPEVQGFGPPPGTRGREGSGENSPIVNGLPIDASAEDKLDKLVASASDRIMDGAVSLAKKGNLPRVFPIHVEEASREVIAKPARSVLIDKAATALLGGSVWGTLDSLHTSMSTGAPVTWLTFLFFSTALLSLVALKLR